MTTAQNETQTQEVQKGLICPHCHAKIPHGAFVCQGCQAEIQYHERPKGLHFILDILMILFLFYPGIGTIDEFILRYVSGKFYDEAWLLLILSLLLLIVLVYLAGFGHRFLNKKFTMPPTIRRR